MKKIYIAGFDVFKLNAKEIGEKYKQICKNYGFEGLYPLDNEINKNNKKELANKIFQADINQIKKSDIIVANLNNFRGNEPDSGTCFECGVGYALGKTLYGYIDDIKPMIKKYPNIQKINDLYIDEYNMTIEDFSLPLNLMLSVSINIIQGDFEKCIESIKNNN